MSATRDLIAAALTLADEFDSDLEWPTPQAEEVRELCARAMCEPDMAEVERLLCIHENVVRMDATGMKWGEGPSATRVALLDYVRGHFVDADKMVSAAEVPMPEPIGFIDRDDDNTWATLTHNAHELAALRISSTVFHVSQMRTYGHAREAAGYAAGLAEAGKDAERYLYLRNRDEQFVLTTGGLVRGCFIDSESEDGTLVLLTGADADDAIDAALRGEVKP